jgi:transposase
LAPPRRRIDELTNEIESLADAGSACARLMSVPGIGPIISSVMVAAIGTGEAFSKGATSPLGSALYRDRCRRGPHHPGPISKRGNRYLRVLFVQAAWVVLIKPTSWHRHGLKAESRQLRSGCIATS